MTINDLLGLLPLLLIVVFFYLLLIRPARARQREALQLQRSLSVGQEVMTTSGLYGRVSAIEDEVVVLETAPGVTSRWSRAAVARVVGPTGGDAPGATAV